MIYPNNFEEKIDFDEIRQLLRERCLSGMGRELVDNIAVSYDADVINEWLEQVREFRRLQEETDDFPLQYFFDVRQSVSRLRLEGTHIDENELFDLRRSLNTICLISDRLNRRNDSESDAYPYPALQRLTEDVITFPQLIKRIDIILDKFGKIRDNASAELLRIRTELSRIESGISRTLNSILRSAQNEGLIDKDAAPTMRDGRLVIPIAPGMKRKIKGIVHDESASGRTVFIEPAEIVEANNRIRELEHEERREIIHILTDFSDLIRPNVSDIIHSYEFLAKIDLIRAKSEFARLTKAYEPRVEQHSHIDWTNAIHPLLCISLAKQGRNVVPLDITLTGGKRILIISGPNAGGKSVCLKTVGLLQYMLQCGISIPVGEHSKTGIFADIMIDIGDEQSMENDLSTYSSHLLNMKNMMKYSDSKSLLLIDEFGTGTEPQIGGAIAEAVLKQFCNKNAYGLITTHYQNLKHFADSHEGVVNGAMLYDRHEMRALFRLQIGQPGSSFAIEIARKTGIPEEVISDASDIVGSDYIQSDKYLQDIVRDKRYWENKRQAIHKREKDIEKTIAEYEEGIKDIEQSRKDILRRAKEQAEELLSETNKKIEATIREIREKQAEKEETKKIRKELDSFKAEVSEIDTKSDDEKIARKIQQIMQRKERHEKRKKEKAENERKNADAIKAAIQKRKDDAAVKVGDTVRIKGTKSVGTVESIEGKTATVIFGGMRTKMRSERLEHSDMPEKKPSATSYANRMTRDTIDSHREQFNQDIDVRGMRGDDALNAVQYFIDDAILLGVSRVRILHGKGNGILRQLIHDYLSTVPNVLSYRDENVQFGGTGITVVDI